MLIRNIKVHLKKDYIYFFKNSCSIIKFILNHFKKYCFSKFYSKLNIIENNMLKKNLCFSNEN